MLKDVLQQLANAPEDGCAVQKWVLTKEPEIEQALNAIKLKKRVNLTAVYRSILEEEKSTPFGKTIFNYHMRGECSCPKA